MHRLLTTVLSALALLAWCGAARAIDCKHARLPAQQVACASPELLKILDERDRAFADARARLEGKQLKALVDDQRNWVKSYPKSCGVLAKGALPQPIPKAMISCFKRASEARITYLRQYGRAKSAEAPAAAPEETAAPAAPAPAQTVKAEPTQAPTAPPPTGAAAPAAPPPAAAAPAAPAPTPPPPSEKSEARTEPAPPAASPSPTAEYHLKFTFACGNAGELPKVISSLAANDLAYPLSRPDCLPVPDGGKASVLSVRGNIAKIRMCTADVGCTDVYIDAKSVLDADGHPVGK